VQLVRTTFGRRLAAVRIARGLTEAEFAAAIGQSEQTIWAWENSICHEVPLPDVRLCARALHCRVRNLLGPTDDPIPPAIHARRNDTHEK
jgi:transcriptional regulator with XRE-family HTH domain